MGIGFSHLLHVTLELTWYQTYAASGILCLVLAVLVLVTLVQHPSSVRIEVAEEEIPQEQEEP